LSWRTDFEKSEVERREKERADAEKQAKRKADDKAHLNTNQMQHQKQNVRCARCCTRYLTRRNCRRAQDENPRVPCRSHAHRRRFPTSTICRTLQQRGEIRNLHPTAILVVFNPHSLRSHPPLLLHYYPSSRDAPNGRVFLRHKYSPPLATATQYSL
ncbi:hypothetical protein PAXRUDRAFT_822919, partial [Paxillus rubicundulus Ve08.2h10]